VHLHRNTTPIILDAEGTIAMDRDTDVFAVPSQMLVDGVVHHLKHAVVKTSFIGVADIHAGAEADGLEAFEMLDLLGAVGLPCGYMSRAMEVVMVV
jgi:hypothetical protein